MWDDRTFEFDPTRANSLDEGNPFRRYIQNNRPGAMWPIRSVLSSVTRRFNAFAILESPYLDLDFWDNHSRFYSGSFKRYRVWCERVHFFEGAQDDAPKLCDLLLKGASEADVSKAMEVRYLGYCVLRPTPAFVVSRTALTFDERDGSQTSGRVPMLDEEKESKPFLKVKYSCESHILNARFRLTSVEFIQQDPNLGHCGTAALWVATKAMACQFGTNRFQYGTITLQAIGGWNRERDVSVVYDPSNMDSGVSVSEMRNALAETGVNSLPFMPHRQETPEAAFGRISHEVYSFLESGIPVLLCFEKVATGDAHVVVTVGHGLPGHADVTSLIPACDVVSGSSPAAGLCKRHRLMSSVVNTYYAHDDSYGPFNRVLMLGGDKGEENDDAPRVKVKLGRKGDEYWLCQVLVPVPKIVRNYASQALSQISQYFEATPYGRMFPKDS